MIGNFPTILDFNRLFLKLNQFICNKLPFLRNHRAKVQRPSLSKMPTWQYNFDQGDGLLKEVWVGHEWNPKLWLRGR